MPLAPFLAPERDNAFKRGRPKGNGVTYYTQPGVALVASANTFNVAANTDYYTPYFVDTTLRVDQLAIHVNTTGTATNIRFGLYAADTDLQPVGAPLADSGDVGVGTTGIKTYTPGTVLQVPRGRYMGVFNANGTVTLKVQLGGVVGPGVGTSDLSLYSTGLSVLRTYAAFPTPGTAWDTETDSASLGKQNAIFWRVISP